MASSLKEQLLRAGLAKESIDARIERARKHAEEAQARVDDETLVPAFEAAATGRIVERTDETEAPEAHPAPRAERPGCTAATKRSVG